MYYNLDFDYAALVVAFMAIITVLIRKDLKRAENKVFLAMVLVCTATCVFDITSVFSTMNAGAVSLTASYLLYYGYMIFHNMFAPLCFAYIVLLSGYSFSEKWMRTGIAVISIPWVLALGVIASNPIFHWMFYLEEDWSYHRGPMMMVMYISALFYLIGMYFCLIRFHKSFTTVQMAVLIVFWLISLVVLGIQYIYPNQLLEMFSQALICLGISITISDEDVLYDQKTGLYRRSTYRQDISRMINSGRDSVTIIIRLLNLHDILSVVGYENQKRLSESISDYLKNVCRSEKLREVYTLENDNFALLYSYDSPDKTRRIVKTLEKRFLDSWTVGRMNVLCNAQVIAVEVPMDFSELESILSIADRKYFPGDKTAIFLGADLDRVKRYQMVERALAGAIENNTLEVYYQPIWDCTDNRIHSCEALLRLVDKDLGFIPTDEVINVAENNGTIMQIGLFVFEEVCRFISDYRVRDYGVEFVEINLSSLQCLQNDLADSFSFTLGKYGVPASAINICVSETTAVESEAMVRQMVEKLRGIGFIVSMDNLGTGYSNLMTLFNMRFDIIKIDKTVLWNADDNVAGDIILENTVNTIRQMDSRVAIAGVETLEQKEKILRHSIDYGQGYFFSRPLHQKEAIEYIKGFNE